VIQAAVGSAIGDGTAAVLVGALDPSVSLLRLAALLGAAVVLGASAGALVAALWNGASGD